MHLLKPKVVSHRKPVSGRRVSGENVLDEPDIEIYEVLNVDSGNCLGLCQY